MTQDKADGAAYAPPRDAQGDPAGDEAKGGAGTFERASAALTGLRSAIDQASHTLRELSRAGEKWAKDAEGRAIEIGKGLRGQGARAVVGVARSPALPSPSPWAFCARPWPGGTTVDHRSWSRRPSGLGLPLVLVAAVGAAAAAYSLTQRSSFQ